ncbi:MAG: hypothetical protein U0136_14545 [Bdellovibrionota bacterium]
MVFFLETTLIQIVLLVIFAALCCGLVFYLLNRRDARVDRTFYNQSFDPQKKLKAHIIADPEFEKEADPVRSLRAYRDRSGGNPDSKD